FALCGLELVVQTDTHGVERNVVLKAHAGRGVKRCLTQVGVEVFCLQREVVRYCVFNASTNSPAPIGVLRANRAAGSRCAIEVRIGSRAICTTVCCTTGNVCKQRLGSSYTC